MLRRPALPRFFLFFRFLELPRDEDLDDDVDDEPTTGR